MTTPMFLLDDLPLIFKVYRPKTFDQLVQEEKQLNVISGIESDQLKANRNYVNCKNRVESSMDNLAISKQEQIERAKRRLERAKKELELANNLLNKELE